jgi:hypothetical protein
VFFARIPACNLRIFRWNYVRSFSEAVKDRAGRMKL